MRLLIEKFVQDVPSREHRLALHTCVSAHATTEPLLAAALDQADVHDVFEWLGRLSFVESGPFGLFPHDLARDVVYIDFRWRDPDAAYRVTERLIAYLYGRLERTQGFEKLRTWFDVIYLQRYNSHLRPYMDWEGYGTTDVETASACAITRRFSKRSNGTRGRRRRRSRAIGCSASPKRFSLHAAWPASSSGSSCTCASGGHCRRPCRGSRRRPSRGACRTARAAGAGRAHDLLPVLHASRALSGAGAGAGCGQLRR